jgi:undecaprenyl-diphosphatase
MLIVGVGSFGVFAALAVAVARGKVPRLDSVTVPHVGYHAHSAVIRHIFRVVGEAGGAPGTLLVIAVGLIGLAVARRPRSALFLVVAVACSASSPLLKDAFDRRPPPSVRWLPPQVGFFPSGHAVGSMAVAAALVALAWQTRFRIAALTFAVVLVVAVGLSAVLVGNHWPSDVVGGWALSLGWVSFVSSATAVWLAHRGAEGGNWPADPDTPGERRFRD